MRNVYCFSALMASMVATSCGLQNKVSYEPKFDVSIPTEGLDHTKVLNSIDAIKVVQKNGTQEIHLGDFVSTLEIPEEVLPYVEAFIDTRDEFVTVKCEFERCEVSSLGQPSSVKVEAINIPVFGNPQIQLAEKITIKAKIEDNRLEVCSITGVKIKKGVLNVPFDGALVTTSKARIEKIIVDAGLGGSYPSNGCDRGSSEGA